jgi:hypothetical protein
MNENEMQLYGKVYSVVDVDHINGDNTCANCAFFDDDELCACAPSCLPMFRPDNKTVIFVEKQP